MKLNKIIFNNNKFDGLISLNGNIPNRDFFTNLNGIPIIAADGAADYLHKANIIPKYIVGDMDSISPNTLNFFFERTNFLHISDQETNDFEKAVNHAMCINLKNLLIVGINGGLYEHALNNWSVLAKLSKQQIPKFPKFCERYCQPNSAITFASDCQITGSTSLTLECESSIKRHIQKNSLRKTRICFSREHCT